MRKETKKSKRKRGDTQRQIIEDLTQYKQDKVLTFRDMSHLSYFGGNGLISTKRIGP